MQAFSATIQHESHSAEKRISSYPSPLADGSVKLCMPRVITVVGLHLLALLVFVPWFFSWAGVVLFVSTIFLIGTIGINVGYHRLLSHRSFKCPKWLEHIFSLAGICSLQGTPLQWIALHRLHHQHADQEEDPHTPLVNFLWAHFEWILVEDHRDWWNVYRKYAPDVFEDRFYRTMEKGLNWLLVYIAHAVAIFVVGFAAGWLLPNGTLMDGIQLGSSLVVWGVVLRTVYVWHATWSVNSLTHAIGYRNYETKDHSRNNWFVSILANGEGWHNNHHADPNCAAAGHHWWEFDPTFAVIRGLSWVGLVTEIVPRREERLAERRKHLSVVRPNPCEENDVPVTTRISESADLPAAA